MSTGAITTADRGKALRVSVPKEFTDQEVVDFANKRRPRVGGVWQILREGCDFLKKEGQPERNPEKGADVLDMVQVWLELVNPNAL